jgi:hypothetical protein
MSSLAPAVPTSKGMLLTGRILSGLIVAFILLVTSYGLLKPEMSRQGMRDMGYPDSHGVFRWCDRNAWNLSARCAAACAAAVTHLVPAPCNLPGVEDGGAAIQRWEQASISALSFAGPCSLRAQRRLP